MRCKKNYDAMFCIIAALIRGFSSIEPTVLNEILTAT